MPMWVLGNERGETNLQLENILHLFEFLLITIQHVQLATIFLRAGYLEIN